MTSNNSSQYTTLKGVLPPMEVYGGVGDPYKSSLKQAQENVKQQNELNNQHGGFKKRRQRTRKRGGERNYRGGRPKTMVVPQAPTGGLTTQSPTTANAVSAQAYKTQLDSFINSQYDNLVKVPPIPPSQNGGSLMHRLKRLASHKKRKGKKRKTANKRRRGKKRRTMRR